MQRWAITTALTASLALLATWAAAQESKQRQQGGRSTPAPANDQAGVQGLVARFAEAFEKRDAQAVAALFLPDARVVDEDGAVVEGREAIQERFARAFEANPDAKVTFHVDRIRFLTPDVAVEEGHARGKLAPEGETIETKHTVHYVQRDGAWSIASVYEHPAGERHGAAAARARLEELAWMVGEWVDESDDAVVHTTCAWSEDSCYLLRSFTVRVRGAPALSGTQRIGWDPQRLQIRSWVFDDDGGFSEGFWTRAAENQWVIKSTGTTSAGETVTATNIITRSHPDTMRWQSVDRTVAGEALPDSEAIVIARRPPGPGGTDARPNTRATPPKASR